MSHLNHTYINDYKPLPGFEPSTHCFYLLTVSLSHKVEGSLTFTKASTSTHHLAQLLPWPSLENPNADSRIFKECTPRCTFHCLMHSALGYLYKNKRVYTLCVL